nr:MAG TPA: Cell-membrane associated Mucin15 [Caudoviricetes sp.]
MDVTIPIQQIIGGFVAALGIPSAIMGLVTWRIKKRAEKRAAEAEEREDAREQLLLMLVESVGAALALGEATARAVQRIPDAHCNGDMHAALNYAVSIKHELRSFLSAKGVHSAF